MTSVSARKPSVHFCGIGGTAMVAGARLAIEAGWDVRGSDNPLYPPTSAMVAALGVPVAEGYRAENLNWSPDIVVIGNVLSRGNPEVEAALARRMHYVSLPEWLKDHVLRARRPVVVAGTHGKTTTTALTAYLLDRCGLEPGFLIGGQPLDFAHSARLGPAEAPFVIEGDEYDTAFFDKRAKFFHYLPDIAVVTSIEFDHADIYATIEEIDLAFRRMLRQIPPDGWLLACSDNRAAAVLREHAPCRVATYGLGPGADWGGEPLEGRAETQRFRVWHAGRVWGEFETPLAGRHNLQNTLAAVAVAGLLDVPAKRVAAVLGGFQGVRRRMEVLFEAEGVTFVDDFAHHPTAIRETIAAARQRWPGRRLHVLFEPRSNTTVTRRFEGELAEAFAAADTVWLGPIHRAESIPEGERLDRAALARRLRHVNVKMRFTDDVAEMVSAIRIAAQPGDVVLVLSNGAFGGIYAKLRTAWGVRV